MTDARPVPNLETQSVAPEVQIARLTKRLERERQTRLSTEAIAEKTFADLYVNQKALQARQDDLRLMQSITLAANEADTLQEALRQALTLVCEHTGWAVGHAFQRTAAGPDRLVSTRLWHLSNADHYSQFRQVTEEWEFPIGIGLPGRVWATGQPVWIENLTLDANFPRLAYCNDLDLKSAVAFPIVVGTDIVAVLEFFSENTTLLNPDLMNLLPHIGTQLGRVVDRERAQAALLWQAQHDALTDLPNRTLFHERLQQALTEASHGKHGIALLFLDLDRFKQVNDTLGHAAGDRMLQEVTLRLTAGLKTEDMLARMGGDEFMVLLTGLAETEQALQVAEALLELVSCPIILDGQELFVSGSIGISRFPEDGQDAETLLRMADVAMYHGKKSGGGSHFYTSDMDLLIQERLQMESQLRQALSRQEMVLYYQPQIDMTTGCITALEALVRWQHPTLGLISPLRFIPLAEETGLILSLGQWILEEATRHAASWHMAGYPVRVAVNLSARQFEQPDLADKVVRALDRCGLPPAFLELEMTESVIMAGGEMVIKTLRSLKGLGVRLAIDDFGTGYSSLAYLRRFPVDILKIDRAFVKELGSAQVDTAIVRAIAELAHALGLEIVAEGVETREQQAILERLHCDMLQGYLFSPPVAGKSIPALLRHWEMQLSAQQPQAA